MGVKWGRMIQTMNWKKFERKQLLSTSRYYTRIHIYIHWKEPWKQWEKRKTVTTAMTHKPGTSKCIPGLLPSRLTFSIALSALKHKWVLYTSYMHIHTFIVICIVPPDVSCVDFSALCLFMQWCRRHLWGGRTYRVDSITPMRGWS